jgi:hypothetical protein
LLVVEGVEAADAVEDVAAALEPVGAAATEVVEDVPAAEAAAEV